MTVLSEILNKRRTTTLEIIKALKEEFIDRGFTPSRQAAGEFRNTLESEHPKINERVSKLFDGKDTEDIIMDEFEIPGA